MINREKVIAEYNNLTARYRLYWIRYGIFAFVSGTIITAVFLLVNNMAIPYYSRNYWLYLALASLVVLSFSIFRISLDCYVQWRASYFTTSHEAVLNVSSFHFILTRSLYANLSMIIFPVISYVVLSMSYWLTSLIEPLFMPTVLTFALATLSWKEYNRLRQANLFSTSISIVKGRQDLTIPNIEAVEFTTVNDLVQRIFRKGQWFVKIGGLAIVLMACFGVITIHAYPNNPYEADPGILYFVLGLPPAPSIALVIIVSIGCGNLVMMPYRSLMVWLIMDNRNEHVGR